MTWQNFGDGKSEEESKPQDFDGWTTVYDGNRANNTLLRMKIPGGWLYRMEGSKELTFVPDA